MNPADILDSIGKQDARWEREQRIEKLLGDFRANAEEASDLLPALLCGLIDDEELSHYTLCLKKALQRYQQRLPDEGDDQDEGFSLWRARQED